MNVFKWKLGTNTCHTYRGFINPEDKGLHCLWPQRCFAYIKYCNISQGCKPIPSLRQTVSLLRENINIFINVTYLYMLHVCMYKIHNMIRLLCTKVKFYIKYLFGTRLHYLKELMIFISNL